MMNYLTTYMMKTLLFLFNLSTCSTKMNLLRSNNTENGFGPENWAINICIMQYELLDNLHDEHPLLLVQFVHLLHEDDLVDV